ncbi:short-chain dehydrogenase [Azorhizobium oxalatiphilum]|uniref:Short-chain dehydrogenase n=1 Tax=Azorhizobium oxalatiphilum TaxID=980631 RepID=A0A917BMZ9_9HYPH|nr:SDR family NAD(P)-dependent oxidoreductase [Azorhizobium oxalatiphilum]GGF50146.1 short-chain dehydrogenase [Azorhizobium oxalatiphilum]
MPDAAEPAAATPATGAPVAIVTGAGRGIGFASARELARKGYRVALVDLGGAELDGAVATVASEGVEAIGLPCDVSDYALVQDLAAQVLARWGRIDVLVNNAGISQPKPILDITEAEWDLTINVNLKGCFNWCKAVAPKMVDAKRGRIINMSSVSANTGAARSAVSKFAYCASKAGVLGLTRGLAKELAPYVTVNAICPGSIETHLTAALIEARRDEITNGIPLGRVGTPQDIAVVVAFLATVEPNYITGEVIDVDGGQWVN